MKEAPQLFSFNCTCGCYLSSPIPSTFCTNCGSLYFISVSVMMPYQFKAFKIATLENVYTAGQPVTAQFDR